MAHLSANMMKKIAFTILLLCSFSFSSVSQYLAHEEIKNETCVGNDGSIQVLFDNFLTYVHFDGNQRVKFDRQVFRGLREFTVTFTIRINPYKVNKYIAGLLGQDGAFEIGFKSGYLELYINNDLKSRNTNQFRYRYPYDGDWHNITISSNGENIYAYLDGNIQRWNYGGLRYPCKYNRITSEWGYEDVNLQIGNNIFNSSSSHYSEGFEGDVANICVWDKYMNKNEVLAICDKEFFDDQDNIVACYNFDRKDDRKIHDVSKNKNDGVLSSEKQWRQWVGYFKWRGPRFYSKDRNIYNLKKGKYKYSFNIKDHNGGLHYSHGEFEVGFDNDFSINIIADKNDFCEGELVQLSQESRGGLGSYKYNWEMLNEYNNRWEYKGNNKDFEFIPSLKKSIYRCNVFSGVCKSTTNPVTINRHRTVKASVIYHKK